MRVDVHTYITLARAARPTEIGSAIQYFTHRGTAS